MNNQDQPTKLEQYFKHLNDALQIKDVELRKLYVEDLDKLWASETLNDEMKNKMASQGLYQTLFMEEMVREYDELEANEHSTPNLEDYTMMVMDKVEGALER